MDLPTLQKNWELLASTDPLWAILTDPAKKNRGWDTQEFFDTGVSEVQAVLAATQAVRPLAQRRRALDFGCGVGRLSQALAGHFDEVSGVDIAPTMIELARNYNRYGDRCQFILNSSNDLSCFPDGHFDFVYSNVTLQHIHPRFSRRYIEEFVRVLAPAGVALFQLPAKAIAGRLSHFVSQRLLGFRLSAGVRKGHPVIEMHAIDKNRVISVVEGCGAKVVEALPDQSAGPTWESYRYVVSR